MNGGERRELVILGSGPAGLTAAIYAARGNLKPVIIEGIGAGGQLRVATAVANCPGLPDGIMGPDLMTAMRLQAERFGAEFMTADCDRVDLSSRPFLVSADRSEYRAGGLIIATGATARMLGIESEQRLLGYGVSTCATCDGFFFRGQAIAVVGGGDSALEEAIFLTKFATQVTVVHRRDELRASIIMQDRAVANDKLQCRSNSVVGEVVGNGNEEALPARNLERGRRVHLPVHCRPARPATSKGTCSRVRTHCDAQRCDVRRDHRRRRGPRPGGFLGRVVWPLQDDCPGARGDRLRAGRKDH